MSVATRILVMGYNAIKGGEENIRSTYNAMKVADVEHERIHAGRMFSHCEVHSLASGGEYTHLIHVASGNTVHLRQAEFDADGKGLFRLFKNPYIDPASLGTDMSAEWLNMNDTSSYTLPCSLYGSTYINVASGGTQMFAKKLFATGVGPASAGAAIGITREWVLKGGNDYALHYINEDVGAVSGNPLFLVYDVTN